MRFILLIFGTVLTVLFIVQLIRGKKFNMMVENLDEKEFPLGSLYIVGFSWSATKFLPFQGKRAAMLKNHAGMLYEIQYAEYYANIVWAQAITMSHLLLTVTLLIAGIMYDSLFLWLGAGIFFTVLCSTYCMQNMKNILEKRTQECEIQLPEVVSTMAILVNSGMVLRDVWIMVSNNGNGAIYDLMCKACKDMDNGCSEMDAIYRFGISSNSTEIKKFTSALLQSMEKGGGELGVFLAQQSSELWNTKRQKMLQSGEKAATKLLLPIVLIFVGIIIIVMTAAFAGSLF